MMHHLLVSKDLVCHYSERYNRERHNTIFYTLVYVLYLPLLFPPTRKTQHHLFFPIRNKETTTKTSVLITNIHNRSQQSRFQEQQLSEIRNTCFVFREVRWTEKRRSEKRRFGGLRSGGEESEKRRSDGLRIGGEESEKRRSGGLRSGREKSEKRRSGGLRSGGEESEKRWSGGLRSGRWIEKRRRGE
ncbi:hypothetical protein L484_027192 [Morus notabilis]|uniref:Uncharacterized protein n=1 Tax=Morus notabilis TaxID=981085 RepID=W9SQC3_9ROSA|nr:hypothetical protein L484_027192 [Morus notabilis]